MVIDKAHLWVSECECVCLQWLSVDDNVDYDGNLTKMPTTTDKYQPPSTTGNDMIMSPTHITKNVTYYNKQQTHELRKTTNCLFPLFFRNSNTDIYT